MLQVNHQGKSSNISFKQANVNIMALSDTHGDLRNIIPLYQNFQDNQNDIFEKKNEKSTLNVMAVVGDWFMNPTQKGYISNKDNTSGDYQTLFFKSFINKTKEIVPRLKVLYTPGNHCLEGGDKAFLNNIKNLDMDTIITNANLKEAPLLKDLSPKQRKKIQEYKIIEVEDDKNPNLKHKVLVLGVLPINMAFLVSEDIKGLNLFKTRNCKEVDLKEKDTNETAEAISIITNRFKEENPDAAVVLMNHSGEPIAKILAKKVGNINLILNGHDHIDKVSSVENKNGTTTKIVSLAENGKKLEAVKLHFDDDGNLSIKNEPYYTNFEESQENNPLQKLYNNVFKKDLKPLLKIIDPLNRDFIKIDDIRYNNNDLANFCTDAIYSEIKKTYPDINAFMIRSTAFRENIPTSKTRAIINIDIINLLKGLAGDSSEVMVGQIQGKKLADVIYENVLENFSNPHRNTINQYSGVIIDKAGIKSVQGNDDIIDNLSQIFPFIKIRNEEGEFEEINPEKTYTIALPKKIFTKTHDSDFQEMEKSFTDTDKMVCDYFRDYITHAPKEVVLQIDKRILT